MQKTQLISVRLETHIADTLSSLIADKDYLTRSCVINRLLAAMLYCTSAESLRTVLETYDPYDEGVVVRVSIPKN